VIFLSQFYVLNFKSFYKSQSLFLGNISNNVPVVEMYDIMRKPGDEPVAKYYKPIAKYDSYQALGMPGEYNLPMRAKYSAVNLYRMPGLER